MMLPDPFQLLCHEVIFHLKCVEHRHVQGLHIHCILDSENNQNGNNKCREQSTQ